MGALTRAFNWADTPLGPPDQWPQSLKTTLGILLHSAFPMFLFWGDDLLCFYNDAYRPSLGTDGKHPAILGKPGKEAWPEIWEFIGPLIEQVMTTGEPAWFEDQLLPIYRNGQLEDVYWTFSYSPAYGDDGQINGVFVTCSETTANVIRAKQQQELTDLLQVVFDSSSSGIGVLKAVRDEQGSVIDFDYKLANRVVKELNKRDDLVGQRYSVVHAAHKQTGLFKEFIRVTETGQPIEREVHYTGEGFNNWYVTTAARYDDGVVFFFRDITLEKTALQRIEQSEERFQNLIREATVGIIVLSGEEMIVEIVNDAYGKLIDRSPQELLGKPLFTIIPETESYFRPIIEEVRHSGDPLYLYETSYFVWVDGVKKEGFLNLVYQPYREADGTITGVMVLCQDVTEQVLARQHLEEAEAALRGAIELAELATWRLDIKQGTISYSKRFMDWLGFSDDTKALDEAYNPLPDEYRQSVPAALEATWQPGGSGLYDNEHPIVNRLTGQMRIIRAQAQVLYDTAGTPAFLSGTAQDITKDRRLQQELERQVVERTQQLQASVLDLQRSNDNLEQFAYVASHDLQEPLRKIMAFSDLLKSRYNDQASEEVNYLNRMQSAASRMSVLIKDLLNFSRISTRQEASTVVPLGEVVSTVLTDLDLRIQETGAVIWVDDLPAVQGDRSQLEQLFQNLLTNALKFRRMEVTPDIRLSARQVAAADLPRLIRPIRKAAVYHCIDITDNGIGFDTKYIDRIFQVFQRLHSKTEFVGTGIGLAICEKVVANHGGGITATSQPGQGATFSVYLPV